MFDGMGRAATVLVALAVLGLAASCSSHTAAPTTTNPTTSIGGQPVTTTTTAGSSPSSAETPSTGPEPIAPGVLPAVEPIGEVTHGEMVTPDGRTRTYRLYRPSKPSADATLVLALHGGTGNGDQFAQTSGYEGLAEANGFIVAFPDGTPTVLGPRNLVWNAGGCCAAAVIQAVDDVGFLNALVDKLAASDGIDPAGVLVTGHSNGAMMGLRMACQAADRVAAVAVQAGTVFVDNCRPSRPVSVLDIHGNADENVPIEGGRGPRSVAGVDFPPIRVGLQVLAAPTCPSRDAPTVEPGDLPGTTLESWGPCDAGIDVELLIVDGADHDWMGHPSPRTGDGPRSGEVDASELTWAFLSAHRYAGQRPSRPGPTSTPTTG